MKSTLIAVCTALILAVPATSQHVCPADKAAEHGHNPFETFHKIMAPAWHDAYPAEDYDALIAVAPEFKKSFVEIAELEPKLKSEARTEHFMKLRDKFGALIDEFAAAAEAGDKEKVYALMPDVHTAFEQTAASLVPVEYDEFEALKITVGLISDEHLPKDNKEAVQGSTETLILKTGNLNKETIPNLLIWSKEDVLKSFDEMQKIAAKMKTCCDNDDMQGYRRHLQELQAQMANFEDTYL